MARQPKTPRMLTHGQIWTALDRLAERSGLSPSGLAKSAGLDPTTFNKSKRIAPDGRERWPSTESVAKALTATSSSIDTFVQLIGDSARTVQSVPLLGFAQAGSSGHFDDNGFPAGKGWDEVALPSASDEHAYARCAPQDRYEQISSSRSGLWEQVSLPAQYVLEAVEQQKHLFVAQVVEELSLWVLRSLEVESYSLSDA